jgi:hypothetical protein
MTADDKLFLIGGLGIVATLIQPFLSILASRLLSPTPEQQAHRSARRSALKSAVLRLLGSVWFLPLLSVVLNVSILYYQLTRVGPVTRLTILAISLAVASVFFSLTIVFTARLLERTLEGMKRQILLAAKIGEIATGAHERLDRLEQKPSV